MSNACRKQGQYGILKRFLNWIELVFQKGKDMIEFLKCIFMIVIFLVLFTFFGFFGSHLMKRKSSLMENLVLGFFTYFTLFQLFALPLILLKQHLTLLTALWLAVVAIVMIFGFVVLYKERITERGQERNIIKVRQMLCYFAMAVLVLFFCYFTAIQNYWGWDTAFYIGTVSTTVDTDTMYLINGESGVPENVLPLRYALSGFYMNSAVFCKITGITAVYFQKYVMGTLCVLLYFSVLYLVGQALFQKCVVKTAGFLWAAGILNLFFVSEYTTSQFLILRAYEAKAYCANVVVPAIFWLLLLLHKDLQDKGNWRALFLVMLASVPVSMSAILIAPAMVLIAVLGESIVNRSRKIFTFGVLCILPNAVYLVVYLLYTLDIWVIKV